MASVGGASLSKGASKTASAGTKKAASKPKTKKLVVAPGPEPEVKKLLESVATAPKKLDSLSVPSIFPLESLQKISTPSRAGQVFRLDGGFLDALRLQVRRLRFEDGEPGYQIELKVAGPSRPSFEKRLVQKGAEKEDLEFFESKLVTKGSQVILEHTGKTHGLVTYFNTHSPGVGDEPNRALRLSGTGWQLDFMTDDGPLALRGQARVLLRGSDASCKTALFDLIQKVGLHEAFAPPTPISLERYKLMKLLWHTNPKEAAKLSKNPLGTLSIQAVKTALKAQGIGEAVMKRVRYEEVAPGHFTLVDPELPKELQAAGFRYAYSTVAQPEHVLSILENGQKATLTRWSEGALISGMSSMDDLGSGGAQGVFSRLVTENAHGESWNGRRFRIVLKPDLLARLDIWGWTSDMFGQSWDLGKSNFAPALVAKLQGKSGSYSEDNEIISPVGNGPKYIACVTCANESDRKELLKHLKSKGYKPPGGKSLDDFVKLEPKIRSNLLGGKAPKLDDED